MAKDPEPGKSPEPHEPSEAGSEGETEEREPQAKDAEGAEEEEAEGEKEQDDGAAAEQPAAASSESAPAPAGAAWGEPIARFERRWTWLEVRLITFVLVWQLLSLVAWVMLNGLSARPTADSSAGTVFRGVIGGVALAVLSWAATRKLEPGKRRAATIGALVVGAVLAPLWRSTGVDYFDNVKGWLQEGSTLTLMGGLRGLATRLTLWLALLGASLATAAGKHIHIDLIFRFLPKRLRLPAAITNYVAAAVMCLAGVWGFFDHIAIESYGSKADDTAGAKVSHALHEMGQHAFLTRKQIGLDLRSLPHVLAGERYDSWMSAGEWNGWLEDAGFEDRYPAEQVKGLVVPEDSPPHAPLVIAPDGSAARGMLVHDLSLVFPFGLLVVAIRFLLRAILSLSGHIPVDPDEAHKEEIGRGHDASAAPAGEPTAAKGGA